MRTAALLYILVILLAISSCKKTNSGPNPVFPDMQYLSAATTGKYAGTLYATGTALTTTQDNSGMHPVLYISAANVSGSLDSSGVNFVIYNYPLAADTIAFNDTNAAAQYIHYPTGSVNAMRGSMILTSVSPYITATYTFTCTDLTIVSGSFKVIAPSNF